MSIQYIIEKNSLIYIYLFILTVSFILIDRIQIKIYQRLIILILKNN